MDEKAAVSTLTALANSARLRVFRTLVGAGPGGLTPSDLGAQLSIPASTLSFHLKELVNARLLEVQREGRQLNYRPNFRRMDELMAYLVDHCCQGNGGEQDRIGRVGQGC